MIGGQSEDLVDCISHLFKPRGAENKYHTFATTSQCPLSTRIENNLSTKYANTLSPPECRRSSNSPPSRALSEPGAVRLFGPVEEDTGLIVGLVRATRIDPKALPSAVRRRRPECHGSGKIGSFRAMSLASSPSSSLGLASVRSPISRLRHGHTRKPSNGSKRSRPRLLILTEQGRYLSAIYRFMVLLFFSREEFLHEFRGLVQ